MLLNVVKIIIYLMIKINITLISSDLHSPHKMLYPNSQAFHTLRTSSATEHSASGSDGDRHGQFL